MSRCVILSAGPVSQSQKLAALLREDDYILAADGGWQLAAELGVQPSMVIADFDSFSQQELPTGMPCVRLPIRKDVTDTAAAVEYAFSAGWREFLLLGCTGGRLDHQHAAMLTMVEYSRKGARVTIADADNRLTFLTQSPYVAEAMPGWSLSLFAFEAPVEGLCLEGMAYSLSDYTLQPSDSLCVSNACENEVGRITFRSGELFVYRSKD